ncbi:21972_t:CDS:2, partial [Gigaspora margarita]
SSRIANDKLKQAEQKLEKLQLDYEKESYQYLDNKVQAIKKQAAKWKKAYQQEQQQVANLQQQINNHNCLCPNICCANGDYNEVKQQRDNYRQQLDNHTCPTTDNSELVRLREEVKEKAQKIAKLENEIKILKDKPPVVDNSEVERLLTVIEEKEQIIKELEVKLAKTEPQIIKVESEEVQELRNKLVQQEKRITRLHVIYLLILSMATVIGLVSLIRSKIKLVRKKIKNIPNRQGEYKRKVHHGCYLLCSESGLRISEAIKFDLTKKDKNGLYRINKPKGHESKRTTILYWRNIYEKPFAGKIPVGDNDIADILAAKKWLEDKKEPPKLPTAENFPQIPKNPEPIFLNKKPATSNQKPIQQDNSLLTAEIKQKPLITNYQPKLIVGEINQQLPTITNKGEQPNEKEQILLTKIKNLEEQLTQIQAERQNLNEILKKSESENKHLKAENKHLKALIQQFPETETKIIQPLPN